MSSTLGPSRASGLFPRVEDEREFRRLFRRLPLKLELWAPFAEFGAWRRTTRFLGAGLVSRLPAGEGFLDGGLLPLRAVRVRRLLCPRDS
jgi:hypothetical protein